MVTCPACAAENPSGARFCNQCGARLEPLPPSAPAPGYTPRHLVDQVLRHRSALEGERKRVTVLFADIKGSTRLAQQAGEEAWHGILDRFFAILARVVHRYEGTINQYTGDGIMALFGAPLAHEDHASRACLSALEMQREIRAFADELRLSRGLNLSMRIGLNSGEVIVGRIGDDLRMDYTAQGATVHLAARLEALCEPGRVYLTRHTARQVQGYFQLRELGPLQLAGVDEAMEVYELERFNAEASRLDLTLTRSGSPFVGREPEFAALEAALARVQAGAGQVVAVVGNAGMGKSRLFHEFARHCVAAGIPVHRGAGVPYHNAAPLHPLRMLARSRMGLRPEANPDEVRRLVAGTLLMRNPQHAALLPAVFDFLGVPEPDRRLPDGAGSSGSALVSLLTEYLCCCDEPQVLMIEDLQFLDPGSEALLAPLCEEVHRRRSLLLLNYRPDYPSEPLLPLLDEEIHLGALDARQVADLAQHLLGADDSVRALQPLLVQRAGGNPFFVEEAVQALVDAGLLEGRRGGFRLLKPLQGWPVPDSVHGLLAARMDRLPEDARTLLHAAAVLGPQFRRCALSALQEGEDDPAVEGRLQLLQETGFLQDLGDGDFRFCHPLMQEVAYQSQLESRRLAAHRSVAERLAATAPAEPGALALQIAHHFRCAGENLAAGQWSLVAARWVTQRDMRVAVQELQNARAVLAPVPGAEAARLRVMACAGLIRLAQFLALAPAEVEQAYAEAQDLLREHGDVSTTAELMISYANHHLHRGRAEAAARLAGEAAQRCLDAGERELVHRFRLALLLIHSQAGRPRDGLALLDAAGMEWRTRVVDEENYQSRAYHGLMLCWMGRLAEGAAELEAAKAVAERLEESSGWIHGGLVDVAWFTGDYTEVLSCAEKALARAEALKSPYFQALAIRAHGQALSLLGRFEEAIPELESASALVQPGAYAHQFETHHWVTLATAYAGAGRHEEALETARRAISAGQRSGSMVWEIWAWMALLRAPQPLRAEVAPLTALARLRTLIDRTGAVAFEPWLRLMQAHWADERSQRALLLREAAEGFERQGAWRYAQVLKEGGTLPILNFLEG